jgi:phosphoglucosamine mutase
MGKYFGTDGFRGEANAELTAEHAFKIGRYLGGFYGTVRRPRIVIGKDTRRSGYMLEAALTAGLTASGADVFLMHVTTTPSVAYIAREDGFDCGVMISASHNPYYDNGIKLLNGDGEKMPESVIEKIEAFLDWTEPAPQAAMRDEIGRTVDYSAGRDRYVQHLIGCAPCRFDGVRVGLDCANGSTWKLARQVFEALGAEVHVISDAPDGLNINRDCGSTHIGGLCRFVPENKLDIGFAFDGDADRCLCVDHTGKVVTGDHIMYLCAQWLRAKGELAADTVVTTVMSNFGLYKALEAAGMRAEKTAVGDKYVYENMRANGYSIGGEQSGHIIFLKLANTGDGMLTAIQVLGACRLQGKTAAELAAPVTMYPQVLKNVIVTDKAAAMADPIVQAAVDEVSRRLGDTGRVLLRPSGTEPVLRVMSEAATEAACEAAVDEIIESMRESGCLVRVR